MTEHLFLYPFIISVQCVSGSYFTSRTQRMRSAATSNYTTRSGIVLRSRERISSLLLPTLYNPRVQKVGWCTYTDTATTLLLLLLWIIINRRIMGYLLTGRVYAYIKYGHRNGGERVYGELIPSRWLKIMPRYAHPSPDS